MDNFFWIKLTIPNFLTWTIFRESPEVLFNVVQNKGIITLNRPKALNALNLGMAQSIYPGNLTGLIFKFKKLVAYSVDFNTVHQKSWNIQKMDMFVPSVRLGLNKKNSSKTGSFCLIFK